MKETADRAVWSLDEDECWNLLTRCEVGRLAVVVEGRPEIFPVNHVVDGPSVLFRTAHGSKLAGVSANPDVSFEVDEYDEAHASSAVVRGTAHRLELQSEMDLADALPLSPWIPTLKYHWVKITPRSITGRRFARIPEPARYRASRGDEAN